MQSRRPNLSANARHRARSQALRHRTCCARAWRMKLTPRGATMVNVRTSLLAAIPVLLVAAGPTAAQKKAIDAIEKVGGYVELNEKEQPSGIDLVGTKINDDFLRNLSVFSQVDAVMLNTTP